MHLDEAANDMLTPKNINLNEYNNIKLLFKYNNCFCMIAFWFC